MAPKVKRVDALRLAIDVKFISPALQRGERFVALDIGSLKRLWPEMPRGRDANVHNALQGFDDPRIESVSWIGERRNGETTITYTIKLRPGG